MEIQQERRPRTTRGETVPFRITSRDVEIVRHVYLHRCLRSDQIIRLLGKGASEQQVLRRLALLFHNGYLDRPREQFSFHHEKGGRKFIYALGNGGARLLSEQFGETPRAGVDWTDKNRTVTRIFTEHTVLVSEVAVSLVETTRTASHRSLISREQLLERANETQRRRKNPLGWQATIEGREGPETIAVIPDYMFGVHVAGAPAGKDHAYFFVEVDRGTMPIKRRTQRQTSFWEKMLAYHRSWQAWRDDRALAPFGFVNFRVLTVTLPERVGHLVDRNKELWAGKGSGMFLFTDDKALATHGVFDAPWMNGRGESVQILPR